MLASKTEMRNVKSIVLLAACFLSTHLALTQSAVAANCTADFYALGSNQTEKLFHFNREEVVVGDKTVAKVVTKDLSAKVVVTEELTMQGPRVLKYVQDEKQTGESGALEVKGDSLVFSYTKNGETKTATEDSPDDLIVPPAIEDFLKRNWTPILKGDSVSARFAVLDRKETVGFKFFKISETKFDGQEAIVVKMKPTSIVISALVDPLLFTMSKDGARTLKMEGRVLAKQQVDDKWKDLDAEIVYHYGSKP